MASAYGFGFGFISGMVGRFGRGRRRKTAKTPRRRPRWRCFESLERRNLLSTVVWTGGGTTNQFDDAGNYAGGSPATNNDALVFTGSTNTSPYDDMQWVSLGSIEFQASGFNVHGCNLGASQIIVDPGITATVSANIVGPNSLTETGSGTLIVGGDNSYTGGTNVLGGTLIVSSASALPYGSSLTVGAGGTFIFDPTAAAATTLVLNNFSVNAQGQFSVQYTINGADAPPFSIGIYSSADGTTPGSLLQTFDLSDPSDLAGGGATHTATFDASVGDLTTGASHLVAGLDAYNAVQETSRAGNVAGLSITSPLSGTFQQDDGSVYVFTTSDTSAKSVTISENSSTGAETVTVNSANETFQNVSGITVCLYGGNDSVSASGVSVPLTVYGGSGSDTIGGGDGDNTIYGGAAGGNTITAGAGTDTIYGNGSSGNTITGGAGQDTIYAGNGPDSITGSSGNDIIYAGPGHDNIVGGSGNNEIYGGSGTGTLDGRAGKNNYINGGSGNYTIWGSNLWDWPPNGNPGSGNDWITCGTGNDTVYGGTGNESIVGGPGNDDLEGGIGTNEIYSGTGTNYLQSGGLYDVLDGELGTSTISSSVASGASVQVATAAWDYGSNGWTNYGVPNPDGPTQYGALQSFPAGPNGTIEPQGTPEPAGFPWQFNGIQSMKRLGETSTTPVAVYVAWNPNDSLLGGDHWASGARYAIYDGNTLVDTVSVNQQNPCPHDSPDPSDHPWKLLGVYNFSSDTIKVKLYDGNSNPSYGEMLNFGDAMIRPIWPTVSVRADEDGTGTFSAYDDYLNATDPAAIPVEGNGPRMELDLSASVDALYAQLGSMSDWHAVLPAVSGLEFWSAATGGTQITSINDQFSSSQYDRKVWVSIDPASAATINVDQIAFTVDPDGASVTSTVDAEAVSGWTRDTWAGSPATSDYSGHATSHGNDCTLRQLAKDITGNAGDYWLLRKANPGITIDPKTTGVPKNTTVDISPLLAKLEKTLRTNVAAGAGAKKFALSCWNGKLV